MKNSIITKVYLAGGFCGGWQINVKTQLKNCGFVFMDPSIKEIKETPSYIEYGVWGLHAVKNCDIVFAYMQKDNPSGVGLAVEIGYAKGLGKTVILVLEKNNKYQKDKYLDFLRLVSDITFNDLQSGINYLNSFKYLG